MDIKIKKQEIEKKRIDATIIADSINEFGDRVTTFVLTFPRFILAEVNTHRVFSRNSASSRAIPFKKMVEMVREDPFIPMAWQKDHSGMQGTEYLEEDKLEFVKKEWVLSSRIAASNAGILHSAGVTKQLCNRMLEPYMWHTAIVTTTELENFFEQRCPQYQNYEGGPSFKSKVDYCKEYGDNIWDTLEWLSVNKGQGEIHIMELAECMYDAVNDSTPKELKAGDMHIPFGDKMNDNKIHGLMFNLASESNDEVLYNRTLEKERMDDIKIKIATARCARVSYLNFEGKDDYEADVKLYSRLMQMNHMSPFEHVAMAMDGETRSSGDGRGFSGNLRGFVQLRQKVEDK